MGNNVSHGSDLYGQERRSATTIHNLGKHLAHVLPASGWAAIRDLFDGSVRTPVSIEPTRARVIAAVLRRGAAEWRMPATGNRGRTSSPTRTSPGPGGNCGSINRQAGPVVAALRGKS